MFAAVVTVLFRTVLDEGVCVDAPAHGKKVLVTSKPDDTTIRAELNADNLRAFGRQSRLPTPTMWN